MCGVLANSLSELGCPGSSQSQPPASSALRQPLLFQGAVGFAKKAWEGEGCLPWDHPGTLRNEKGAWDASHGLQSGEVVMRVRSLQCAVVAAAVGKSGLQCAASACSE